MSHKRDIGIFNRLGFCIPSSKCPDTSLSIFFTIYRCHRRHRRCYISTCTILSLIHRESHHDCFRIFIIICISDSKKHGDGQHNTSRIIQYILLLSAATIGDTAGLTRFCWIIWLRYFAIDICQTARGTNRAPIAHIICTRFFCTQFCFIADSQRIAIIWIFRHQNIINRNDKF